jgi:lysophospholipase L1-like esterase
VPESVWGLGHHSAGEVVRFVSDAATLQVRWELTSASLAMPHMPATGVSGVDLYVKLPSGEWRWLANGQPRAQTNTATLASDLPPGRCEFLLYLPLYNGVRSVELGLNAGADLAPAGPWGTGTRKPIVFYGTSITQGGCASRPGMAHVALVGRRFNFPTINLGFSGSGRMEPALADLLAELDPSVFVLDCLPNLKAAEVAERTEPFVRRLRAARPHTPIVLVEDRNYTDAFLNAGRRTGNEANHAALRAAYQRLKQAGVKDLHYLRAEDLLGADGEDTVDGSHPTDLGFVRHADAFAKVLKPLLKRAVKTK